MKHICHAVGCSVPCQPEFLMCRKHWGLVPQVLKARVYRHYRRGQCDDKNPSRYWLEAAAEVIKYVAQREAVQGARP